MNHIRTDLLLSAYVPNSKGILRFPFRTHSRVCDIIGFREKRNVMAFIFLLTIILIPFSSPARANSMGDYFVQTPRYLMNLNLSVQGQSVAGYLLNWTQDLRNDLGS